MNLPFYSRSFILHPTSYILHPTSDIRYPRSDFFGSVQRKDFVKLTKWRSPRNLLREAQLERRLWGSSFVLNEVVIPPNSNTFSDWRRTCHMSLVKSSWRPKATTTWTFDSHVIRSCTLKPRQICLPAASSPRGTSRSGNTRGLGETKLTVSLGGLSLRAY